MKMVCAFQRNMNVECLRCMVQELADALCNGVFFRLYIVIPSYQKRIYRMINLISELNQLLPDSCMANDLAWKCFSNVFVCWNYYGFTIFLFIANRCIFLAFFPSANSCMHSHNLLDGRQISFAAWLSIVINSTFLFERMSNVIMISSINSTILVLR